MMLCYKLVILLLTVTSISGVINPITINGNYSINNITTSQLDIAQVMSVPIGSQVTLICQYNNNNNNNTNNSNRIVEWSSNRSTQPVVYDIIQIANFTNEFSSTTYTCSVVGTAFTSQVLLTSDNPKILSYSTPHMYTAFLNQSINLSICISYYQMPGYVVNIIWSHAQSDVTNCATNNTAPGCYNCQITLNTTSIGLYTVTANLYSGDNTIIASDSTQLQTALLTAPNFNESIPEYTNSFECDSLTLQCAATGNPITQIDWYYTPPNSNYTQLINNNTNNVSIQHTTSSINVSTLSINKLSTSNTGVYVCSFIGAQDLVINSSTLLTVHPRLCLSYRRNATYHSLMYKSLLVLDFATQQPYYLYCTGYNGSTWYRGVDYSTPISYNTSFPVYQSVGMTERYLIINSSILADIYTCKTVSGGSILANSVYLTHENLPLILDAPDIIYTPVGDNLTISAYINAMISAYTINWWFTPPNSINRSSIVNYNWTINSYTNTIHLSTVTNNSYGSIFASYSLDNGNTNNYTLMLVRLEAPELILQPSLLSPLEIWETSSLEIVCALRNVTSFISGPRWSLISPAGDINGITIINNNTLVINNITSPPSDYKYSCGAQNKAGEDSIELSILVYPLSYQLINLIIMTSSLNQSLTNLNNEVNITINATQLINDSSVGLIELTCSVATDYDVQYLNYSDVYWKYRDFSYNSSLSPLTQSTTPSYIRLLADNTILLNITQYYEDTKSLQYSTSITCTTRISNTGSIISKLVRINIQLYSVPTTTTAVSNTTTYSPHPPEASHIVLFFVVPNCSYFGYNTLLSIKQKLLESANSNCSYTYQASSLHFINHYCHNLGPIDIDHYLLTLCAAVPVTFLACLNNIEVTNYVIYNISSDVSNVSILLEGVLDDIDDTHCKENSFDTTVMPTNPSDISYQSYSLTIIMIIIFSVALIIAIIAILICFMCIVIAKFIYTNRHSYEYNQDDNPSSPLTHAHQTLGTSHEQLVEISPSRIPTTFKTASGASSFSASAVSQELESRPFSRSLSHHDTSEAEPVTTTLYANPVTVEFSSSYSAATSFGYQTTNTNNNNNNNLISNYTYNDNNIDWSCIPSYSDIDNQ